MHLRDPHTNVLKRKSGNSGRLGVLIFETAEHEPPTGNCFSLQDHATWLEVSSDRVDYHCCAYKFPLISWPVLHASCRCSCSAGPLQQQHDPHTSYEQPRLCVKHVLHRVSFLSSAIWSHIANIKVSGDIFRTRAVRRTGRHLSEPKSTSWIAACSRRLVIDTIVSTLSASGQCFPGGSSSYQRE